MSRKPIPEQTQINIFLKSRRRCCLCFWLKSEDEVKKGQIAHIDNDHANAAEGNLVFLCLEHHDEYDSTTRLSKGLRQTEVKRWRDELYREMQYRFRAIKTCTAELTLIGFRWRGPKDEFYARFRIKNTGEVELSRIAVAIRLPAGIGGEVPPVPQQRVKDPFGIYAQPQPYARMMWEVREEIQDLFEPGGRVCIKHSAPLALLMPGHSEEFDALTFHFETTRPGDVLEFEYRIDAQGMSTVRGNLDITIPSDPSEFGISPPEE